MAMATTLEIRGFFKETDSSLGIFYPTHYIVASFRDYDAASAARAALLEAGVPQSDVLTLPGAEMAAFLREFREQKGTAGDVMTSVSRFLGDDATFVDDDIARGERGAGFLIVYCATGEESSRLRDLMRPFGSETMHWYLRNAIEELI